MPMWCSYTALETSGFFRYESFKKKMLPWLDLICFDIKLIDEADSKQYPGRSNKHVLGIFPDCCTMPPEYR